MQRITQRCNERIGQRFTQKIEVVLVRCSFDIKDLKKRTFRVFLFVSEVKTRTPARDYKMQEEEEEEEEEGGGGRRRRRRRRIVSQ